MAMKIRRETALAGPARELPDFEPLRMAELIESCRAHAVSVTELAEVTSRALYECYQYEANEPHLGQCCDLVRHVLDQAASALVSLGVVSYDVEPRSRATEIEHCEVQGQSLTRAMHVVRATISIVGRLQPHAHEDVLLALRSLEGGIGSVIEGMGRATRGLHHRVSSRSEH